jgi:hypothetical protein
MPKVKCVDTERRVGLETVEQIPKIALHASAGASFMHAKLEDS